MIDWFNNAASVESVWDATKKFGESNFATALVGSLAGAFFGAWAAQRSAAKAKRYDELLAEIRNTNAAAILLYQIAGSHLGLKKQHVKALHDSYLEGMNNWQLFDAARRSGTVPPQQVFQFNADLQMLRPLRSPADEVQKLVFSQTSLPPQILVGTSTLFSTMQSLDECLKGRNDLIDEWKKRGIGVSPWEYFATPRDNVVDARYKSYVEAIYSQTDDVIEFSKTIADKLYGHAISIRSVLRSEYREPGPPISRLDYSHLKEYFPPSEEYADFRKSFEVKGPVATPWYRRIARKLTPVRAQVPPSP